MLGQVFYVNFNDAIKQPDGFLFDLPFGQTGFLPKKFLAGCSENITKLRVKAVSVDKDGVVLLKPDLSEIDSLYVLPDFKIWAFEAVVRDIITSKKTKHQIIGYKVFIKKLDKFAFLKSKYSLKNHKIGDKIYVKILRVRSDDGRIYVKEVVVPNKNTSDSFKLVNITRSYCWYLDNSGNVIPIPKEEIRNKFSTIPYKLPPTVFTPEKSFRI